MIESDGKNLIFLISQPRSGSTLLQRILAGSPEIHTTAEPWIALAPTFALRSGNTAIYNAELGREATQDFLSSLQRGEHTYWAAASEMLRTLYNEALFTSQKTKFLDKTPRYYHIIPELNRMFPGAKFIFLVRNPLAVLASLKIWTPEGESPCDRFPEDLFLAPGLINQGIKSVENAIAIRYESLVSNPQDAGKLLCARLGIDFSPDMVDYGSRKPPTGRMGDALVENFNRPVTDSVDKWRTVLKGDRSGAEAYLSRLDASVFAELGYDLGLMREQIKEL